MNCPTVIVALLHWPLAALHGGDDRQGQCGRDAAGQGRDR